MSLYIAAAVALVGLVVYALASGKASELGRIAFACGLLALLLALGAAHVRLLP